MTTEKLIAEIIELIITSVNLHHINREEISEATPLMANGLELDSVDVLEVVVSVENHFGVKVEGAQEGRTHFQTIGTIARFVETNRTK